MASRVGRLPGFLFSAFFISASPHQVDATLTFGLANNVGGWNNRKTATFMYFKDKRDCPAWANAISERAYGAQYATCHVATNGHTMLHISPYPWCDARQSDNSPCRYTYTWSRRRDCPNYRRHILGLLEINGFDSAPGKKLDGQSRYGYGSLGCPYYQDRSGKDFNVLGAGHKDNAQKVVDKLNVIVSNHVSRGLTWGYAPGGTADDTNPDWLSTYMYFNDPKDCPKWAAAMNELARPLKPSYALTCHVAVGGGLANGRTMLHFGDHCSDPRRCRITYQDRTCAYGRQSVVSGLSNALRRKGRNAQYTALQQIYRMHYGNYTYGAFNCPFYNSVNFNVLGAGHIDNAEMVVEELNLLISDHISTTTTTTITTTTISTTSVSTTTVTTVTSTTATSTTATSTTATSTTTVSTTTGTTTTITTVSSTTGTSTTVTSTTGTTTTTATTTTYTGTTHTETSVTVTSTTVSSTTVTSTSATSTTDTSTSVTATSTTTSTTETTTTTSKTTSTFTNTTTTSTTSTSTSTTTSTPTSTTTSTSTFRIKVKGEEGFDACAGLLDPAECDMLDASQCGRVVFGSLEVSVECPVLCDNCETIGNGNSNVVDAAASSGDSGGMNGGAVVGIVILLLLLAAAVAFIYVTHVRNAKEDTAGGSSAPVAFENPMYDAPVQSHSSSMVAMMDDLHTKGLNDNALDERSVHSTQSLVSTDETHNESSSNAVESTANLANVVVMDASGGAAEEAFDGFGESSDADGGAKASAVQAVALFAYAAADDEDVSFEKGDTFADVEDAEEEGWLQGTVVRTGESGTFPDSYVQRADAAAAVDSGVQMTLSGVGAGMEL